MSRWVIAVSGTPGVGKSVFSRTLAKKLRAKLIDIHELISREKIYTLDPDATKVVSIAKLQKCFRNEILGFHGPVVAEGLLAHFLPKQVISNIIVLRINPKVLERRLRSRNYTKRKIRENVEAEALDLILWEAVVRHSEDKVYEIDITKMRAAEAVRSFLRALDGKITLKPGNIDWLERYFLSSWRRGTH